MKKNNHDPIGVGVPLTSELIESEIQRMKPWTWRVFTPYIIYETCKKCNLCIDYCPEGVIAESEKGPVIDYRLCKGCRVCVVECPFEAIKVEREETE